MANTDSSQPSTSSPFLPMFETFRAELDDHHDRRERIIKASRDITAASKKIIFALQRVRKLASPIPPNILKSTEPHQSIIRDRFCSITADLQTINAYRYYRQISGGIQEWMEAVLFQHYLATQTLMSFRDAMSELHALSTPKEEEGRQGGDVSVNKDASGNAMELDAQTAIGSKAETSLAQPLQPIDLTPEDYLLGFFDTTGELMRFCITSIATSGSLPLSTSTSPSQPPSQPQAQAQAQRTPLTDLQSCRRLLTMFDYGDRGGSFARDASKKLEVTLQSVEKVERAMYGMIVRGSERPKGWVPPDLEARAEEVEGY